MHEGMAGGGGAGAAGCTGRGGCPLAASGRAGRNSRRRTDPLSSAEPFDVATWDKGRALGSEPRSEAGLSVWDGGLGFPSTLGRLQLDAGCAPPGHPLGLGLGLLSGLSGSPPHAPLLGSRRKGRWSFRGQTRATPSSQDLRDTVETPEAALVLVTCSGNHGGLPRFPRKEVSGKVALAAAHGGHCRVPGRPPGCTSPLPAGPWTATSPARGSWPGLTSRALAPLWAQKAQERPRGRSGHFPSLWPLLPSLDP